MYKKFIGAMYIMNIVFQSFFTLLTPIGIGWGIAWLLTRRELVGDWIYALLIVIGVLCGLVSMIRFVLSAMAGYERLEKQGQEDRKE